MARPRFRWLRTCTLALVASGGLFGGCQKIFGEYKVAPEPPLTFCAAGDKRCVGLFLYSCGPDLDSWVFQASCRSEAHCSSREGGCLTCAPGEYRCSDGVLEVCANGGFSLAEDCGDVDRCNLNSDSCRPCTDGEYQCNQGNLMQCSDEVWLITPCANEAACSVATDRRTGACAAPACTEGMLHVCDGAQLMRCSEDGQQLVEVDTCKSPELCDATAADQQANNNLPGTCLEACAPDAARCVDAEFQLCSSDGSWQPMTTCASPNACSAKLGSAGCLAEPCAPGSLECNDGELRRCTETGWELAQDCGAPNLCNEAAGKCEAAGCPVAGEYRCDPGGLLYECSADQTSWGEPIEFCDGDLCNANDGDCDPAACTEDAKRCWNNTLEACSSSLLGWDVLELCEPGETCSLEGCSASACTEGDRRCNDIYLETCVGQAWQHVDRCATPALCDPSQPLCEPPACETGEIRCDGASLWRCLTDRTGYDDGITCGTNEVCDPNVGDCVAAP